jgi:universal stress protein A
MTPVSRRPFLYLGAGLLNHDEVAMSDQDYTHLLLAVDFAPDCEPVIARAMQLRALCGAKLSLLHILEYVPHGVELMPMCYTAEAVLAEDFELENRLVELAQGHLDALAERLQIPADDRHIRVGSTGHSIRAMAEELGVDLVVIGSHGRHGLISLLGSTAKSVVQGLSCDLLCVRIGEPA